MFENAGGKVKGIAQFSFWVEMVGVLILAYVLANAGYEFQFLIFILIVGIGFVVAYLSVIMLIAFGELVENSAKIVKLLERRPAQEHVTKFYSEEEQRIFNEMKNIKSTPREDFWICPKCGKENHKTVGTCGCGQDKTI